VIIVAGFTPQVLARERGGYAARLEGANFGNGLYTASKEFGFDINHVSPLGSLSTDFSLVG
jgi:hypothetical protein